MDFYGRFRQIYHTWILWVILWVSKQICALAICKDFALIFPVHIYIIISETIRYLYWLELSLQYNFKSHNTKTLNPNCFLNVFANKNSWWNIIYHPIFPNIEYLGQDVSCQTRDLHLSIRTSTTSVALDTALASETRWLLLPNVGKYAIYIECLGYVGWWNIFF